MTSTPVSASTKSFFMGNSAAVPPANTDGNTSFSETMKNQKNNQTTDDVGQEPQAKRTRVNTEKSKTSEKVSKPETKEKPVEESTDDVVKEAEEQASQLVSQTAEELGVTEEEVMSILQSLSLIPTDLLQSENLKEVVLTAKGADVSELVTDEKLFESFKNLTDSLDQAVANIAEATGLSEEDVKGILIDVKANQENNTFLKDDNNLPLQDVPVEEFSQVITNAAIEPESIKAEVKVNATETTDVETDNQTETVKSEVPVVNEKSVLNKDRHDNFQGQTNENAQNPFLPNQVKAQIEVNTAIEQIPHFDADTEMILHQITDYMKGQITDGVSELDMQLHPENLGTLHVKLSSRDGLVTAHFTAQNDVVKQALESQMVQLQDNFKEQGVTVEAIEVTVDSHRFDENLNQNSNQNMQENDRQKQQTRSRRINLNHLADEEELSQEEELAANLLRQNGNTVDYSA